MALTVELVTHDLMGGPRKGLLVSAEYQIVAWTPYESGAASGVRDQVDFSTAAGGGTGVTLRLLANGGDIPVRFRLRQVSECTGLVLAEAPVAGTPRGITAEWRRAGATTFDVAAFFTGSAFDAVLREVTEATDLTAFVSATPSHARFTIRGQPSSDPVNTPLGAF